MPNWCYNSISISGDAENIAMIAEIIADTNRKKNDESNTSLHFKNLVGIPRNMSAETYEKEWYDTNIRYWGCKWDVDDLQEDVDEDFIHLSFDTAWSPATGFCRLLSEIYNVEVEIFYYEGGCDFCGQAKYDNGNTLQDDCYGYREGMYILDKEMFWNELENDIECGVQDAMYDLGIEYEDALQRDNKQKILDYLAKKTIEQFGDIVSAEDIAEINKMYLTEIDSNITSVIAMQKSMDELKQPQTN